MNVNQLAKQRCTELLVLAKSTWKKDKTLAKRYVSLCRKLAMRHRLKLGRRVFCKKCNAPFIMGETIKVRTSAKEKCVVWKCVECSNVLRFPVRR
ncbi:MAG: hypothetical protein V1722_01860 [Candidatus Micrarchaeota archaeon]